MADLFNKLISLPGFGYDSDQGIFYSRTDAWQRNMGYFTLYDQAAPLAGCIIHCEPIRFTYGGKNWNIELWKGKYGPFIGAEVGVYTGTFQLNTPLTDRFLRRLGPNGDTRCAEKEDWLKMLFTLKTRNNTILFKRESDDPNTSRIEKHWWLTGFKVNPALLPSDLICEITIYMKDRAMLNAFIEGLTNIGYTTAEFRTDHLNNSVKVTFDTPKNPQPAQWALQSYEVLHLRVFNYLNKVFQNVNYSITDLGLFIKDNYRLPSNYIALLLKKFGYGVGEVGAFLKNTLNRTKNGIIGDLKFSGFALAQIANFILDRFRTSYAELGRLLKNNGYSFNQVASYFKTKLTDRVELKKLLKQIGYTKEVIINFISQVFGVNRRIVQIIWNQLA